MTRARPLAALAALALAAGCGSRTPAGAPGDAPGGAPARDAGVASPIPAEATQLVLAVAPGWDVTTAAVQRYERAAAGAPWRAVGAPIAAVIGRAGAAWGRGLHGAGAPARPGPVKREGDGRSPAGAFRVVRALGYAAAAPPGARLPYQPVAPSWRCVDDPASAHYNQVLDAAGVAVDWASAEELRRADELYRWVVELDHNHASAPAGAARAVPGDGSCIFLHVWGGPDDATAGCTAIARAELEAVLAWLRPDAVFVLLPEDERAALAAAWGLP